VSDYAGDPLDLLRHDKPERHNIAQTWGVPDKPPPGASDAPSYGVSNIPARSDHTHGPSGSSLIYFQEFVHAGEITATVSPEDWWDDTDLELFKVRAWLRTAAGAFTLRLYKDTVSLQTIAIAATTKATEVTLGTAVPFTGWSAQAASGNKASVGIEGVTAPSGRFDLTVHLLYREPA